MRRLAPLLLAAAVVATGCSETSTDGAVLYGRSCGACHGGGLGGGVGPALTAGSLASTLTDAEYRSVIMGGAPGMPATSLDDEQLDALIAYIRQAEGG